MKWYQILSVALLSSVLFACGGGSDGGLSFNDSSSDSTDSTDDTDDSTGSPDDTDTTDTTDDTDTTDSNSYAVLSFESADPTTISITGSTGEGTSETSTVKFKLLDLFGEPLVGETVDFSLIDFPTGTELLITSASTDDLGEVFTVVKSGDVEGPITVKMVPVSYPNLFKVSNNLSVTNGYPDQDSFSLSSENYAPEGFNYDGVEVAITIRLGGGDGNTAVPDGTVVNFRTNGGKITNETGTISTCSTIGSACSMVWESQEPRPDNGRAVITAYSTGEESFIDSNRDGLYTSGESFTDNPEAFADIDGSGEQNDEEWFDDADNSQSYTIGNGLYDGLHCPTTSDFCIRESVTIFTSIELVMASSDLFCSYYSDEDLTTAISSVDLVNADLVKFYVAVTDENGNTPPTDTSISSETSNGTISGDSTWTVTNSNNIYYTFPVTLAPESTDNETSTGSLIFALTTPKDDESSCSITVTD